MDLKNKKVAVLGLGIEGRDLVSYLSQEGSRITVHDQKKNLDISGIPSNIKFKLGNKYLDDLDKYDIIFRSPGIYPLKPELKRVKPILSSGVKLFFDLCPGRIIGVTGTKGKGTTTTLIYEILGKDGRDVYLAGNIGKPLLELLHKLTKDSWVVLELSSFQLIDLAKSPDIAVILNITVDHLDWHKDEKEYLQAKKNIVRHQGQSDSAVINFDYGSSKRFEKLGRGKKYFFSRKKAVSGAYVLNNKIYLNIDRREIIGDVGELTLRGEHNWENVTAAVCASALVGASVESIKSTVFKFKGLEHRLEFIREVNGVNFYNDSFSTGPDTVIAAVNSFTEPITMILGGYDKGLDYSKMAPVVAKKKNVRNAIIIGDIGEKIKNELIKSKFEGELIDMGRPSMREIVRKAFEVTPEGGVVLLSPGASSFDMFESYKQRGELFKQEVNLL